MIQSMTGYGKAECLLPDKKLTIELRSLNSKQMDTSTRLPAYYKEKELEIRQIITASLERGKVECTFYFENAEDIATGSINEGVVRNYFDKLKKISLEVGLEPSSDLLSTAMRMPDAIRTEKAILDESEWEVVRKGLQEAIRQLSEFRRNEGEAMDKDLRERVAAISKRLEAVEALEGERMERIRERIGNNLSQYLNKEELDENRFEQELIFYLEKLDVSEEKVRLAKHCSYFLETMENHGPVGKKLGFISQEMGREINTLGSKANHAEIQRIVVEMKDELERIKEQVLNVL